MPEYRPSNPMACTASKARVVLCAMTFAGLAGCAVGPDYKRPDLALPARYAGGTAADATIANGVPTSPAPAPIPSEWWKLYNDPLLDRLVASALANNADLRLAVARIDEARGVLRETNAALFPEVDLAGVGARQRIGAAGAGSAAGGVTPGSGVVRYGKFFQLDAKVSYELDFWGRLARQTEAARASLLSTTYARDVTALTLAGTTAQAYFALRALDAQIAVTDSTRAAVSESAAIAKLRLDAGYASGLDYAQAQTLAAQAAVQLRELRRQRALQEHQLGNLTGNLALRIEPGSAPGALDNLPVPGVPPPGLPSTLLERRPDVRSAEENLIAANAQIGLAKAAMFPTFSLTGAYGGQSFELSNLLKAPFRFWTLGLGVSAPIFAAGRYAARVDQARARTDQEVASYQKTVETAFREVSDALTNVAESSAAEAEVDAQVDAARRALRLSRERYRQGYSAYLDVLDATRTANSAELLLVQNRQARLNYSVDLIKALGGGWNDHAPPTSSASAAAPAAPPLSTR